MQEENLLLTKLIRCHNSGIAPFHMPGHKRRTESGLLENFPNPYSIDITEISGFDNLHHPEGILKDSMEWAAGVYGAKKTYYLVNGSSGGILSAISAAAHPGGSILMGRNCHKSVYHGVILNQLHPRYIYPQILKNMGIQGGIQAFDVENLLNEGPVPDAVLIVSPTYDGIVSDVRAIAEIVHKYGIPLIVDEAHGAHFPFGEGGFPKTALGCGADMVIQSLHKTLPSFTQTAVLHVCGELVDIERLERFLQVFQSSSPSYIFMAGIERCIYEMGQNGITHMEEFALRLQTVRDRLKSLKHLKLLGRDCIGEAAIYDIDQSKIVISCRGCTIPGQTWRRLGRILGSLAVGDMCPDKKMDGEFLFCWLRDGYQLELEMCGADYVAAITTFMDSKENLDKLAAALLDIDGQIDSGTGIGREMLGWGCNEILPDIKMVPSEAAEAAFKVLPLEQGVGRISAEFIYLYPPGIPVLAPGELVTEEIISRVRYFKEIGLPVQGLADIKSEYIRVVI